ncbi:MAG: phage tail sheath family protein [Chitinophagaceae bacterium]|nr:phage tail sheath family protein [Chitinophagaceae bacterium]
MSTPHLKTPGIFIEELNAFPNAVVPVATAVPAFIGYTPQASYEGRSYLNQPMRISSLNDFLMIFGYPNPPAPAAAAKQYHPEYYVVAQAAQTAQGNDVQIDGKYYSIVPDASTIYYLYNSLRLFYENGGGDAYIVSVGTYGAPSHTALKAGEAPVNPNIRLPDLLGGLSALKDEPEPTLYICPDATLLSADDYSTLMKTMLAQSSSMGTSISILDIKGGHQPDALLWQNDIQTFRDGTGLEGLSYGAAYYPFVKTQMMQDQDIDYTQICGGDMKVLSAIINPVSKDDAMAATIIAEIQKPHSTFSVAQLHQSLMMASKTYCRIVKHILDHANVLPPSGAMAGLITNVDAMMGPWKAPANRTIAGAVGLPIQLSDMQQGNLNVDAVSGKSVNAIRFFNGIGILVWGARTLDGNSNEWRYISVRRMTIFLEQSCQLATRAYVFEPNNANTWQTVISMLENFLMSIWKQGGLQGNKPSEAFHVQCGLGVTMNANDLLDGILRVNIQVAVVRPAEFIMISFEQLMSDTNP